jgi:hypothetical protein
LPRTAGQNHPYFVKFTPHTTVPVFVALLHQIKLYETDKCKKIDLINGDVIRWYCSSREQ